MRIFRAQFKDRDGEKRKTAKWYLEFRDHLGRVRRMAAFADRPATAALGRTMDKLIARLGSGQGMDRELTEWVERLPSNIRDRLAKFGLLDAELVSARKSLLEHLDDFEAALSRGDRNAQYVREAVAQVKRIVSGCGFTRLSDITADAVERFLDAQRRGAERMSARTFNSYLGAFRHFCAWLVGEGRISASPVGGKRLQRLNVKLDRRLERRALSAGEQRALLTAAENGEPWRGIPGHDRAMLYRAALETGLRWSELRSLTRASLDLDGERPTVTVEAAYSKHRRDDVLPLRPETAATLREYTKGKLPTAAVFRMPLDRGAKMLRLDLAAARGAWIAEAQTPEDHAERERSDYLVAEDAGGRVVDFHALRHTFITSLANAGVHPSTAQALARHSSITLTMDRYTHSDAGRETEAISRLPDLGLPDVAAARKTGTDDADSLGVLLGVSQGTNGPGAGDSMVQNGGKGRNRRTQRKGPETPENGVSGPCKRGVREGTRTPDFQIHNLIQGECQAPAPDGLTTSGDSDLAFCLAFLAGIDPDLAELATAWPGLSSEARDRIRRIAFDTRCDLTDSARTL